MKDDSTSLESAHNWVITTLNPDPEEYGVENGVIWAVIRGRTTGTYAGFVFARPSSPVWPEVFTEDAHEMCDYVDGFVHAPGGVTFLDAVVGWIGFTNGGQMLSAEFAADQTRMVARNLSFVAPPVPLLALYSIRDRSTGMWYFDPDMWTMRAKDATMYEEDDLETVALPEGSEWVEWVMNPLFTGREDD